MLSRLKGEKFDSIHRAIDMLCLSLGERCRGYGLHIQSPWRFKEGNKILLASHDIYEPYCCDVPEDWEYDITGRDDASSSVFDVEAKVLSEKMQGAYVTDAHISELGDISISFSNGVVFEQFVPASRKSEEWRLIDDSRGVHMVCYDLNGEITFD